MMQERMRQGRCRGAALGVVAYVLIAGMGARGEAAAPAAGPASEGAPREVQHQVGRGQNLHLIAGYYYGDARQWERIWELNRGAIRNPNRLETGMMLRVPVDRNWKQDVSFDDWVKKIGELRPRQARATPPPDGGPPAASPPGVPPAAPGMPGPPPPPPGKAPVTQPPPAKAPVSPPPAPPAKKPGASAPPTPSPPMIASALR